MSIGCWKNNIPHKRVNLNGGLVVKKYVLYDVTNDELNILEQEGFKFISELPYLGSKNWTIMFECDKQYFNLALNAIHRT